MKTPTLIILALITLTGCAPRPAASGKIEFVSLGDKPVMRAGEVGSWSARTFTAGKIEVYESWAIVTEPNGLKHVAPLERFGVIRFK